MKKKQPDALFYALGEVLHILYEKQKTTELNQNELDAIIHIKRKMLAYDFGLGECDATFAGDRDEKNADFALCATAAPDANRVKGTEELPCTDCGIMVLRSPDTLKTLKVICWECAKKRASDEQQISE